jgi:valyl-tRNA synthetase
LHPAHRIMMDKTFDPKAVEGRIAADWEKAGAFKAGRPERAGAPPYCIVIPPPNVTGSLHMGHALNNSLQDILCRFERMRGKDVLWQPGTDHAGIATQMIVERQLAQTQQPGRRELGRDKFLEKVWAWKAESGGAIVNQLKRLGASCDWSRERFTMDEGLSEAVLAFFVQLHEAGLIYKDKRLVNWDPKFQTAISDLEVQQVEIKGSLWHFDYPVVDEEGRETGQVITVATTRPETMLGDTAVAVHPDDERYTALVGKRVRLPLVGRLIPIVADEYSDPEKGTGAVKITPAHDFNDFEVGKRHDLPKINVLDAEARMLVADLDGDDAQIGETRALHGLDRFEARKRVVAMMEARGLLREITPNVHMVPHGDRSGVVVEPWLTDQWYVNVKPLAEQAIAAVRASETRILPEARENEYFRWLENIEPWCVSRQLWWGHQIPAWYGPDGDYVVAHDEAQARAKARAKWGGDVALTRDPDVLDTWFSSALWPFSTLGWPQSQADVARYYPTDVLVTGFDILFFWVARMMMAGLFTQRQVPFRTVYIHGLVRDQNNQKMSKTKGNVIDPLVVIDEYGADALRMGLAAFASAGRDIKLSMQRIEGYRNFSTKLWNAARFAEMNGCARVAGFDPAALKVTLNRWIVGETQKAADEVTAALEAFRFNDAAAAVYRFVWNVVCDWYVELAKPALQGGDGAAKDETRATTAWVLDQASALLHPFMPFITEELWRIKGEQGPARESLLALAPWPSFTGLIDAQADAEIGFAVDLISEVRSVRSEMNVPAGAQIPLVLVGADAALRGMVERNLDTLKRLARLSEISFAEAAPAQSAQIVARGATAALPLEGVIDFGAEKTRLAREIKKLEGEVAKVDAKLGNADFMKRAPEEVVDEQRERRAEASERIAKMTAALSRLG